MPYKRKKKERKQKNRKKERDKKKKKRCVAQQRVNSTKKKGIFKSFPKQTDTLTVLNLPS